ncbi:hypothetical protein Tsubulata_022196 [Turnera subulata]|uniref:Cytochrome P450 n=1 Tax=Turnera subulata TaxID=218843 RepID=A0A9Q0GLW1_9ROSI|nr:hypothetical protein Tsubulata_022196 [Turnera subulata]
MATLTNDIQYYFLCFLLWIASTLLLLHHIFKKPAKPTAALRLPPSPPALPLIGHIHHLTSSAHECFKKLSSKYGPLLYIRLGSYPLILVSSASMAADIFKTHDLHFSHKPKSVTENDRLMLFGSSSFSNAPYGDYWRFMKKLCVSELLSPRQIERSHHIRREERFRFLQKILEKARKNEAVDIGGEITALTNNIICRMVMSTRCSGEDNEAERCRELMKESFDLAIKLTLVAFLGPFKKLGAWVFRKQALDVPRRFDELLEKLMKEHEERAKKGYSEPEDKDLMDILLQVYHDEYSELKITRDQMKCFFLDLFVAGTSTSADAMQWVVAELINHPNVAKKLREEIESVVGRNRLVEEADIPSLPYLQAVVKETLRLYPPAPIIPRACIENCKIGDFDVSKGIPIAVNAYSIMRDPGEWENPDDFYPERFLAPHTEQNGQTETKLGQTFNFVAFGGGRRMCPGSNLAYSIMNNTIAAMVQCFDWKVNGDGSYGAKVDMQVASGATISRAHPLLCTPIVHLNPF